MMEDKPKITWKNFKIWFMDQYERKTWFRNFFITGNAWGAFSINSHMNQHTGKLKVMYNTKETALKSAEAMGKKHDTHFSAYKCLFCDGYHIGKNRDNKTEYDKIKKIIYEIYERFEEHNQGRRDP